MKAIAITQTSTPDQCYVMDRIQRERMTLYMKEADDFIMFTVEK